MGLLTAMSKITSFTSKLSSLTPNNLRANIPSNAITKALGVDGASISSITDLKNTIVDLKSGVASAASLAYCSAILLSDGGKTAMGFLSNLATGAMGIITDIYQQIAEAVACQVSMAVQQIVGAITSLVSALQNLVASVLLLADGILAMAKSWLDWSKFQWELEIDKENCKDMLSAIAACYLNKLIGPYIEQFTSKLVGKINELGNNLNEQLFDAFQDTNMLASYAQQQAFLLQKANLQIKGLTKENLLGITNQEL